MLNWAIVGCGAISDTRTAPALRESRIGRLAAVVSRDEERAAAFARKHGAERSFVSFEEMLADPTIDVVYLATPNALHARQAIAVATAGKHLFCEKPMALTVPDCEAMVRAAAEHGVKLGVAFNNRFSPAHQEARRQLEAGRIGEVLGANVRVGRRGSRVSWRLDAQLAGGGALLDVGIHVIDLLRFLVGREVVRVSAFLDTAIFGWPIDQVIDAVLEFEGGMQGFLAVSQKFPYHPDCVEVSGSSGSLLAVGIPVSRMTDPTPICSHLEVHLDDEVEKTEFEPGNMFLAEVDAFSNAILHDTEPPVSGTDGLKAQAIVVAIQESARTGRAVEVPGSSSLH